MKIRWRKKGGQLLLSIKITQTPDLTLHQNEQILGRGFLQVEGMLQFAINQKLINTKFS